MTAAATAIGTSEAVQAAVDRLRRDAEPLFGSTHATVVPVTRQTRESSEVCRVRVTTPGHQEHVFVKVFKPRGSDERSLAEARHRVRQDFSVTTHVFDALQSTGDLRAVEALACYDDLLCLVTREAKGVPLDRLVSTSARWPVSDAALARLERALERVGRWIATFQRVAPDPAPLPLPIADVRDYLDTRLTRLIAIPRARFGEADRRVVLDYFDRLAAGVRERDLVTVPAHGDITPSNVFVDEDAVTVIDFGVATRGSTYLDIARLYTQLEFYAAKPQYRPHVIARLQRAALTGFEPGLPPDNPLFEICAAQHVVCHFLSHSRQPGMFPASIYSRHQCRLHRRWLAERAAQAEQRTARRHEVASPAL